GVLPSRRSRSGAGGSLPLSSCYPSRRAPHSFPTRRSSDLGVAERIDLGGELRQALVDLLDDLAKLLVLLCLFLSELFRIEVDLREQALEGALEGFVLDELETLVQGFQQRVALLAGQRRNVVPEVLGLDDVVDLQAHLFLEVRDVARVVVVPSH